MNIYALKSGTLLFHFMSASVLTFRRKKKFILIQIAEECFNLNSRIFFSLICPLFIPIVKLNSFWRFMTKKFGVLHRNSENWIELLCNTLLQSFATLHEKWTFLLARLKPCFWLCQNIENIYRYSNQCSIIFWCKA